MKTEDIRGAARLASEATQGLADLVEAMHERIARLPGSPAALHGRTTGITGLVYRSIRGVTRLVGGSVDALLGLLTPALAEETSGDSSAEREAIVAALNGVFGDHLAASGNSLAIRMSLRDSAGVSLRLQGQALQQHLPHAGGQVLVLLHGLCMNHRQWRREGHDHGAALAEALGFTPIYLHYNSGLHIADNGAQLAAQLQALHDAWPCPLQRLVLLGHSMGGLVARSAVHGGLQSQHAWVDKLSDLVTLGTPHQGAPLERLGHGVERILGAAPYATPLARLARLRSAGITDLRHGFVRAEDAQALAAGQPRQVLPLPRPERTRSFALAASTGQPRAEGRGPRGAGRKARPEALLQADAKADPQAGLQADVKGRLLGDGLVPLASALGQHADPALALAFLPEHQAVVWGTNHMQLLSSLPVQAQLQRWLSGPSRG
ncbi:MAG TPA: alpha/beta hydrolase [Rubrivivax sp.]|nr:alpha/beta hydrolase [Rubrivivax sp.]